MRKRRLMEYFVAWTTDIGSKAVFDSSFILTVGRGYNVLDVLEFKQYRTRHSNNVVYPERI